MIRVRKAWFVFGALLAAPVLVACPDKTPPPAVDAAPTPPIAYDAAPPSAASPSAAPADSSSDAGGDGGGARFDPKHKCPTGQSHFYMEGSFCRRKCLTNADCGKKERCSAMEYPFVVDGKPAGNSRFCEGT